MRICVAVLICIGLACGRDAPAGQNAAVDTVRAGLLWAVVPGFHAVADSLGDVSGLAMDAQNNVYASDFMANTIWAFDGTGTFVTSIGRKGRGPGEFEAPTGLAVGPDGRLYVRDAYRVSIFEYDEPSGLLLQFGDSYAGPVYADWRSKRATRFDDQGNLLYPGKEWKDDGTATPFWLRFNASGKMIDTVWVPAYNTAPQLTAHYRTGPGGGRMLPGLNRVPFAARPVWDVKPTGAVISGDGQAYRLVSRASTGDSSVQFTRGMEPVGIPNAVWRDSVAALRLRLDSVTVPLDDVIGMPESVRNLEVPDVYPMYDAVYVATDGTVWVGRPGVAVTSVFDVFGDGGEFLRTVILSETIVGDPTPVISADRLVGLGINPETGENLIFVFDVGSR